MKREIIRVEPLASYLEKYKAPTSTVTRHGGTIYHGDSAVRTRHGRDLSRSNRTPDRARAGTVEALCRDGGIIPGENILKVNIYVTSVEMFPAVNEVYRRYFPKDPPARIFVNVPAWNGGFDIEVDCIAAV